MTKEILIERHGPIRYTIGTGGSAGTMQQHLIAEAYPGLLDGLTTSLLYEDHWYQVVSSFDCILLWRYFGLGNAFLGFPATGNPLFSTAAERQKVWGSNPANPDDLCGSKIIFTVVELIAGSTSMPAAELAAVAVGSGDESHRNAMHDPGLPEGDVRRGFDGGASAARQRRCAVRAAGARGRDAHARAVRRRQRTDRRSRHRRRLAARPTVADVGALQTLYRTGRIVMTRAASAAEIEVRSNITDTGFHPPFHRSPAARGSIARTETTTAM
jgi:hypothetical protein